MSVATILSAGQPSAATLRISVPTIEFRLIRDGILITTEPAELTATSNVEQDGPLALAPYFDQPVITWHACNPKAENSQHHDCHDLKQ